MNDQSSTSSSSPTQPSTLATRLRNLLITLVAVILSVAILVGLRTDVTSTSLPELAEESTPLEVALNNGKPSLIEFYANWCTTCQAMAPELNRIKHEYENKLNFVMLNVDNSKWLPEVLQYRVDGIPHFVFLNDQASAIAQSIGEIPPAIMEANLDALIAGIPLPYAEATGQVSAFKPSVTPQQSNTDPRAHGSTIVN
ncbi:thioredoxin family protein [Limnoraphis robusta]|uniref:Thioredoxin family protein n=1 Tax=Limnoraphis robusta CCNP1315 TaxID=3110306 RepID=A0ABU5TRL1_9CYAN|nr:thioredoxin family protein [Limnoraphis robusta]MEA5496854.1 thioredoxin family protein [Limnoraphis robusta BA-68 BA1]MEA5517553.1 thioredoxin family protein [Limnoraphis robusta CCNP1315]MEA5544645.1 thioredoxin family protein [Limnoraphis robusta CCNP1324]